MTKNKRHLIGNDTLRRLTSYASVGVAASLIFAKLFAFWATGSVALLSSLVDSGVDLLASLITAYGVVIALRPPDRDHRYGHGKAESLAALAQATFIVVSSALLLKEAVSRIISPTTLENLETGYIVMGFAIVMTLALLALQNYTVARTKSLAIAADRMHYVGDILINLAVIATFVFQSVLDLHWIDPLIAMGIAIAMCIGAYKIAKIALKVLMDAELPEEDREQIFVLAKAVKGVCGVHDLRTRTDSGRSIIDVHIEMDPNISLQDAHNIADNVSASINKHFKNADILIHQDPFGINEQRLDSQIEVNDPKNR